MASPTRIPVTASKPNQGAKCGAFDLDWQE